MPVRPPARPNLRNRPSHPVSRWIVAALLLCPLAASPSGSLEDYSPPRFASPFDRSTQAWIARIEAYCVAPPLKWFMVDSVDASFGPDSSGWVRTWGQRGWAPPLSILFRIEKGKVVEHRIDSLVTPANDQKLSVIARKIDSCNTWLDSVRKAEADSLAEENANFPGVKIGLSCQDSLDGLGWPLETRILRRGRIGVVVDSTEAPLDVTLVDVSGRLVTARRVGFRTIAEESCPGYDGLPGDSVRFPVAVYLPGRPIGPILVALRGKPTISNLRILPDSGSRARLGLRSTPQGGSNYSLWRDVWYSDTMIAKMQNDDDLESSFQNTYQFQYHGQTIHGYSALNQNGDNFGWLFRTESGWRDVCRTRAVIFCID